MENGGARTRAGGAAALEAAPIVRICLWTSGGDARRSSSSGLNWDAALGAGPDSSPLLEHNFLRLWLETFAPSRAPITLVAHRQQRLAGALGLLLGPDTIDGVPVRLAEGWCNTHSARGGILLGQKGTAAIAPLAQRALGEPWDVLRLREVPRDNDEFDLLMRAFSKEGCAVTSESPMDSPYVPLPDTWDELEKRLDARFRQNLRRRRRRLEEHGAVRLDVVTTEDGLESRAGRGFRAGGGRLEGTGGERHPIAAGARVLLLLLGPRPRTQEAASPRLPGAGGSAHRVPVRLRFGRPLLAPEVRLR